MKITDPNSKKMQVAAKIRQILDEKGWSQQDLANAMDTNKSYVSKILSGTQNLTLEGIYSIERALGAPIIDILR